MRRSIRPSILGLDRFARHGIVMLLASLLMAVAARSANADDTKDAKKKTAQIGVIELSGSYSEGAGQPGIFGELSDDLNHILERLNAAAKDDKLAGVILEFRSLELGRGKTSELRAAVARLRKAGKKVYADLRSGEARDYLLASACDEIAMPESGTLAVTGVRAEVTFYKDLLDKLGVKAEILQKGAYKGTGEIFTRSGMSPEFRKDIDLLVDDTYNQMIDTIAADRKLDRGHVKDLVDEGIFTATEAKAAGLIDQVAYRDQLIEHIKKSLEVDEVKLTENYGKKKLDEDFSGFTGFMKLMQMITGTEPAPTSGKNRKIAVIYVVGEIVDGQGGAGLFTSETIGGDTMVKAIRDADNNPKVSAIVLRIDSPGGSALASDLVWRAVVTCKKPVVASMGDVAASGGYYIAMGAKKIIAEPGTITGSIGVVGGKIALKGLMDKVGVKTEVVSRGKNSGWQSEIDAVHALGTRCLVEIDGRHVSPVHDKGGRGTQDRFEAFARRSGRRTRLHGPSGRRKQTGRPDRNARRRHCRSQIAGRIEGRGTHRSTESAEAEDVLRIVARRFGAGRTVQACHAAIARTRPIGKDARRRGAIQPAI